MEYATILLSKLLPTHLLLWERRQHLAEVFHSARKHDQLHFHDNLLLKQTENMFLADLIMLCVWSFL